MHSTCHAAHTVKLLHARPGFTSTAKIQKLADSLAKQQQQWRDRRIVRMSDDSKHMNKLLRRVNLDWDGSSRQIMTANPDDGTSDSGFLDYTSIQIFDTFFASHLNNWRAVRLHIELIREPMWGLYDGSRFVCAVDLCRTYAAL